MIIIFCKNKEPWKSYIKGYYINLAVLIQLLSKLKIKSDLL